MDFGTPVSRNEIVANTASPELPNELWELIFQYLSLRDIKAVRETWRTWTDIGSRFLFLPFTFCRDRKDIERFHQVMQVNAFAAGIMKLIFQTGKKNIYHMARDMSDNYKVEFNEARIITSDPELEEVKKRVQPGTPQLFEAARACAAKQYGEWNNRCFEAKQDFREALEMANIFQRLKVLDRVDVTLKSVAFTNLLTFGAWICGVDNDYFSQANQEFEVLLDSLANTPHLRLKHLSHDSIPVTFFAKSEAQLRQLTTPLQHLHTLHLSFNATMPPHLNFWKGLHRFLSEVPILENLRLGFDPLEDGFNSDGSWLDSDNPGSWYVPLWKLLDKQWPLLKVLRLDGLVICEKGLLHILKKHASTLRVLELHVIALLKGSLESALDSMRGNWRPLRCRMSGYLREYERGEAWDFLKIKDSFAESWCPNFQGLVSRNPSKRWETKRDLARRARKFPDNPVDRSPQYRARCIEKFAVTGGPWPLKRADGDLDWQNGLQSSEQDIIDEIVDIWDANTIIDATDWEETDRLDGEDSDDDECINVYGGDGFDAFGYDDEGYNENGEHYLDVPDDDTPEGGITHVQAYRETVEAILEHIPRFSKPELEQD